MKWMKSFFYRLSLSENEKEENWESQILCVFKLEDPSYAVHFTTFRVTSNMKLRLTRISILRRSLALALSVKYQCVSLWPWCLQESRSSLLTKENLFQRILAHTCWRYHHHHASEDLSPVCQLTVSNHTRAQQYAGYACAVCTCKSTCVSGFLRDFTSATILCIWPRSVVVKAASSTHTSCPRCPCAGSAVPPCPSLIKCPLSIF